MLEFLPKDVREGLDAARKREQRRRSRLHVQLGDAVFPVLRMWDKGFSLDAARVSRLRGLVDLYDGPRHLGKYLIVATAQDNGELICEYKHATLARDRPALDFWQGENQPAGYLPKA